MDLQLRQLLMGSTVLCTECTLLRQAGKPKEDADGARTSVQTSIRALRQAGLKEKEQLPGCLFSWAFATITGRK
jgi:hypothetical protein